MEKLEEQDYNRLYKSMFGVDSSHRGGRCQRRQDSHGPEVHQGIRTEESNANHRSLVRHQDYSVAEWRQSQGTDLGHQ